MFSFLEHRFHEIVIALLISNGLQSIEEEDRTRVGAHIARSKSKECEGIGQPPCLVALSRDLRERRRFVVIYTVSNP